MMKKTKVWLLAAVLLCAGALASCNREATEPTQQEEIPDVMASVENTSWHGYYNDVLMYQGQQPMLFDWTIDFNANGKGKLVMLMTTPVTEEMLKEFDLDYTYDGNNHGHIHYVGLAYEYDSDFIVDALNHSLDVNLWMHFLLSEDDEEATVFGGRTTLYQSR